jgi:NADP-dependent aldehyde dehydrogenase
MPRPVLITGDWRPARAASTFHAIDPSTGSALPDEYPVSHWDDAEAALTAAAKAAAELRDVPVERIGKFLTAYAAAIEARSTEIVDMAHRETGLAKTPRLATGELPRTTNQLRQAAAAALDGSWSLPTIDSKLNIRSRHAAIGPVIVIGPNNFPLAFNSVAGGDFAAAIAAGNPVIAKAHPSHPGTTRLLAEEALRAVHEAALPAATVQLIYRTSREDGARLVADVRVGATGFTGSRSAGLALKHAADAAGKPVYLEMSSLNPVVVLSGALQTRADKIADEFADSCLASAGQLCTKPGLLIVIAGPHTESFLAKLRQRFAERPAATLLSPVVAQSLDASLKTLTSSKAEILAGGSAVPGPACRFNNTLLRVSGVDFLANPHALQTEAFGNASMVVIASDTDQARAILEELDGQLTGAIYSDAQGGDDDAYNLLAPIVRRRVGRLLNDKMPTGVAVSPAMNHGGPYPATGHSGFTSVGIPASLRRFSQLECYDNIRQHRLPRILQDRNPNPQAARLIDGHWSQADVPPRA